MDNTEIKTTFCGKCYGFWFIKHPFLILVVWLIIMFSMAIIISELGKK